MKRDPRHRRKPSARLAGGGVFRVESLVPPDEHALYGWTGEVTGPPMSLTVNPADSEALELVAAFGCEHSDWLVSHQVGMQGAEYDERSGQHLYCILSVENAAELYRQHLCGDFPHAFFATPSLGSLVRQERLREGEEFPSLPLWTYFVPDVDSTRQRLEAWREAQPAPEGLLH